MPKSRKVLGVSRPGPEYYYFHMAVDGMGTLIIYNDAVVWMVDDSAKEATVVIKRSWEKSDKGKYLKVKRAKIVGTRNHIANLMNSIGMGTPEHSIGHH